MKILTLTFDKLNINLGKLTQNFGFFLRFFENRAPALNPHTSIQIHLLTVAIDLLSMTVTIISITTQVN